WVRPVSLTQAANSRLYIDPSELTRQSSEVFPSLQGSIKTGRVDVPVKVAARHHVDPILILPLLPSAHCWLLVPPLQVQIWTRLPAVSWPPVLSMHLAVSAWDLISPVPVGTEGR